MVYLMNGFLWRRYLIINLNLKKNIYFLIFNGYYEIGIYVLELYCKIYDLEKKFVI